MLKVGFTELSWLRRLTASTIIFGLFSSILRCCGCLSVDVAGQSLNNASMDNRNV